MYFEVLKNDVFFVWLCPLLYPIRLFWEFGHLLQCLMIQRKYSFSSVCKLPGLPRCCEWKQVNPNYALHGCCSCSLESVAISPKMTSSGWEQCKIGQKTRQAYRVYFLLVHKPGEKEKQSLIDLLDIPANKFMAAVRGTSACSCLSRLHWSGWMMRWNCLQASKTSRNLKLTQMKWLFVTAQPFSEFIINSMPFTY